MLHNISFLDQYKTNHYTDRVLQWGLMIDWLMRGFLLEYSHCALREQETVPKYSDISAMITFIQHLIQFYQLPDNVVKDSSLSVIMCTKQCTLQTLCEKFWFLLQSFGELHLPSRRNVAQPQWFSLWGIITGCFLSPPAESDAASFTKSLFHSCSTVTNLLRKVRSSQIWSLNNNLWFKLVILSSSVHSRWPRRWSMVTCRDKLLKGFWDIKVIKMAH